MNADERSRRALALFDELIDLEPAARDQALERVRTEDAALHAELKALLDADAKEGLLERPMLSLLPSDQTKEELPERIGPWRVTGIAGRGGMGAVFLGERDDGQFQQRAAIKLIRLGMDTPELRARFLRERQILAALEHPHIATLLDGGVTDTGAPYFAMQRVEGQPIDAWCDARRSTLRERVKLFLQVCAAVQHAHQNLIVHRDLKPANILIDGEGQAKLLDFGIAKLLDDDEAAVHTRERPYTPHYAAPEQMSGGAITTATDVYGLGVVLRGLLCGRPQGEEGEPLSRSASRATDEQVRSRGLSSPRALVKALRGDLSAIVQQCLQPEPARRYSSVNALANDLRAWLEGTPVSARNPTTGYVLRKFVRRNRWGVALAGVLVLVIAGGVAGVAWQANRAHRAAAEAQAQLDYLSSLLQVLAPSTAEARELDRSRLITEAARRARKELADKPASLAGVELALAQVAQGVGDYRQAIELADAALAQRVASFGQDSLESAEVLMLCGVLRTQVSPPRFEEASPMLDSAVAIARKRAPGSALLVSALTKQSTLLGEQDQLASQERVIAEAATLCEGALGTDAACEEVWLELGSIASRNRRPEQALAPLKRAWEAKRKRLGDDHAATLNVAAVLAWAQADAGDVQGGLALLEQVHAANQRIFTQPTEPSLRAMLRLSRLLKREGQYERAEAMIDEYIKHARRVFGEDNSNTILGYSDRASLLFGLGRFDEAAVQFDVAAKAYKRVKSEINAAITQGYAADSLREAGHPEQGLASQSEAVATLQRRYPGGENVMLARALTNLALTEAAAGAFSQALEHHAQAIAMHRKLMAPGSPNAAFAEALAGKTLFDSGERVEGEKKLRAALAELAASKESSPNLYWEPFALLTSVACANGAADCEQLRSEARSINARSLAATVQRALLAVTQ